jgi:hypothetical protein
MPAISAEEMVQDILNNGVEVSEWESNFVNDLANKMSRVGGYKLSDKQMTKLKAIHSERVG